MTKAILLLTAYFSKDNSNYKPLSLSEYALFRKWMGDNNVSPEYFLEGDTSILNGWKHKSITADRISNLLERKSALALALEKWTKAGIWILNRGDNEYPQKIKSEFPDNCPPIIFGIGDKKLLNQKFIGIVGARNATEEDLNRTREIAEEISRNKYGVVSGGARGVDESSMIGALEAGGSSVGILADSLIKKSTSSIFRKYIIKGQLTLISSFNPEAGFNVGNAMTRNKYIYTLSEATIVVKSDKKGGTWEGAHENIRHKWVPLWVMKYNGVTKDSGNSIIVNKGARWLPDGKLDLVELTTAPPKQYDYKYSLFDEPSASTNKNVVSDIKENLDQSKKEVKLNNASFFEFFLYKWNKKFGEKPISKKEIQEAFSLSNKQVEDWLGYAVDEGYIIKKNKPVKFQFIQGNKIKFVI